MYKIISKKLDKLKSDYNLQIIYNKIYFIINLITIVISLSKMYNIVQHSLLVIILLYIVNILLKNKPKINIGKREKYIYILSFILSLFQSVGFYTFKILFINNESLFRNLFTIDFILIFIGMFFLLETIISYIYNYYSKMNIIGTTKYNNVKFFLFSFIFIFINYMPYFYTYFPGLLSGDSIAEINVLLSGKIISNHHPVLHQLFVWLGITIGDIFFNNLSNIISVSTLIQMIFMALIFSLTLYQLNKMHINKKCLILIMIYYGMSPIFGYYSITMWKDILFGGAMLLFTLTIVNIIHKDKYNDKKLNIWFILTSIFVLFMRNNAIYMYILLILTFLIILKNKGKYLISFGLGVIILYYIITGPLYNLFDIQKSSITESLGIPIQQIGRMAYKDIDFEEDEKFINNIMEVSLMRELYNPVVVDSIKFNEKFNVNFLKDNLDGFINVYCKSFIEHPTVFFEGYLTSTIGYWYPDLEHFSYESSIAENDLELNIEAKDNIVSNYVRNIAKKDSYLISMQWSIGLAFWVILILFTFVIIKKNIKKVIPFMPVIGIWLTLMIASPVYGEFRYVFSFYTCLPVLIVYTMMLNTDTSKKIIKSKRGSKKDGIKK